MWFKNIRIYRVSAPLSMNIQDIERALSEYKFTPCMGQDAVRVGFSFPLHASVSQFCHAQAERWFFAVKRQEKVLPAAVIQDELQPKVEEAEKQAGRPLTKKEKQTLKEDLIQSLLPRAFSRSSLTHGYYDAKHQWLVINASSSGKAEDILSLLRKALGSVPALPWLDQHQLNHYLQAWLQQQHLPLGFELGTDAELKAPDEEGAKVKFSNHLLTTEDVQVHLQDKLVTRLRLQAKNGVGLTVCEDGSVKQLVFPESISSQHDDLGWDDLVQRLDADLLLMADTLNELLSSISQQIASPS